MTATSTRSSRRAEAFLVLHAHADAHTHPHPHRTVAAAAAAATATTTRRRHQNQQNSSRPLQRLHDATNLRYYPNSSPKATITVDIPSKSQYQARLLTEDVDSKHKRSPATIPPPPKQHGVDHQTANAPSPPAPPPATAVAPPAPSTASGYSDVSNLTQHQLKLANGIAHELDRPQPSSADMAASNNQGRKLRSQESVRFKSELSAYFPEYDEVMGNVPKQSHALMTRTPIVVVDRPPPSASTSSPHRHFQLPPSAVPFRTYGDDLFTRTCDSQDIDLNWLESQYNGNASADPLPDSYYESIHKKEYRNEKITRNAEKCRSQHEKAQVIRLLDGLRGPDWLRTMGVSGITESKKKQFEPARAYFIHKCEAVLEKFAKWAAEEKRLKLEKEYAAKESRASQETTSSQAEEDVDDHTEGGPATILFAGEEEDDQGCEIDDEPPDICHSDASAQQLREEAMPRSRVPSRAGRQQRLAPGVPPPLEAQTEFTSFFKKSWQRDAALNKSRRRGRTMLAWGHALPELEEQDFELAEEFRDEEVLKARARRMRILRRGSRKRG